MQDGLSRSLLVFPGALLVLAAVSACSTPEQAAAPTATKAAGTQVVGAGASATATTSAGTAGGVKFPGTRQPSQGLLGSIPNSPPRATATPLPPGVTATPPPPPATPPPAKVQQISFYVDTVTSGAGESPFNVDPNISCVRSSAFSRGMHVVWRIMAYDNTGTEIQPSTAESIVLKVGGKDVTARYGPHGAGENRTFFWTATWDVPMDFPLGAVDYTIEAKTKSGLSGTFKELPVFSATTESRFQIVN